MNRSSPRAGRRPSIQRVIALITLFWIGYAASFAHDVTVRHIRCAAHGEWMHEATAAHEHGCTSSSDDGPQLHTAPTRSADEHDHCSIVIVARGADWLAPMASLLVSAPVLDGVRAVAIDDAPAREVPIESTSARGPPA